MTTMSKRKPNEAGSRRRTSLVVLAESSIAIDDQKEARERMQEQRKAIEAQLKADEEKLERVRQSKALGDIISEKMNVILDSFNRRLEGLEDTIGPLHTQTMKLTLMQSNLAQVDTYLAEVLKYYSTSEKVARRLETGPSINLEEFLGAMNELQEAIRYFEKTNNSTSPEFKKLNDSYDRAKESLGHAFHDELEQHSEPIVPKEILEQQESDLYLGLSVLPKAVISTLKRILAYMKEDDIKSDLLPSYAKIRGEKILTGLEASVQRPVTQTPSRNITRSQPRSLLRSRPKSFRKVRPPDSSSRMNKRASMSQDMMMTPAKTPKRSGDRNFDDGFDTESLAAVYEKGTHPFIIYCKVMLRSMIQEQALLQLLLQDTGAESLDTDFAQLAFEPVVSAWVAQSEAFYSASALRNLVGPSELFIFDVLLFFHGKKKDLASVMRNCSSELLMRLNQVALSFADLGRKILMGFLDQTQGDSLLKVPPDGTVHEHTTNTLSFLSSLYEYDVVVGSLLTEGFTTSNKTELNLCTREQARDSMSSWLNGVLDVLCDNMSRKARQFESQTLQTVFMMNNLDYILRYLVTSPYIETIRVKDSQIDSRYIQSITKERKKYQEQTWGKTLDYLKVEAQHLSGIAPGSLTRKEREVVKEKYSHFNEEFEMILKEQRPYAMPNKELRDQVNEDNINCVVPQYNKFDKVYRHSGFSQKNPQKYLKYSGEEIQLKLANLFSNK
eukprot:m.144905 g.144905  ORF g.144905 m.144905 type:complete len:726 (-) comp14932_c0_seq3:82-2259(-)